MQVPLSHNLICEETPHSLGVPSSSCNVIPGFSGAKKRSLDQPYMVANESAWPLAAENWNEMDSPGMITGASPLFSKVPDCTNGLESSTFSTVMVEDIPICWSSLSSLSQATNRKGSVTRDNQTDFLCSIIVMSF